MKRWGKVIAAVVLIFGLINLAVGITFVSVGVTKHHFLTSTMKEEKITLGIADNKIQAGEVIDTMSEAQAAGDIVRGHRHAIAPTYGDLLGGQKYDPTNVKEATYAQAMNIENYLYLAAASFGITYLSMGVGAALILAGLALAAIGVLVYLWTRRLFREKAEAAAATA